MLLFKKCEMIVNINTFFPDCRRYAGHTELQTTGESRLKRFPISEFDQKISQPELHYSIFPKAVKPLPCRFDQRASLSVLHCRWSTLPDPSVNASRSIKQSWLGLGRSPGRWQSGTRGFRCFRIQMTYDLYDDLGMLDTGDDPYRSAAGWIGRDVDPEYPVVAVYCQDRGGIQQVKRHDLSSPTPPGIDPAPRSPCRRRCGYSAPWPVDVRFPEGVGNSPAWRAHPVPRPDDRSPKA
jgi:hypothetical protein